MPISEFEGNISWGYNPTHYFAIDKAYGTDDMFKKLIDECHKRGIAVIIDMVFNHATGWAPFNKLFGGYDNLKDNPYFNVNAPHDGNVFEDFNHEFDLTLKHFTRVLNYWLKEYKIDGYRMDLSHGFCGPNCNEQKRIMYHYFNEGVKAVDPNAYFILEHWDYNRDDYARNGMMCWENTGEAYQELAMGWFNEGKSDLYRANNDNYVSYAESHDEERCGYKASQYGNGAIKTDKATRLSYVPAYVAMSTMLNGPQMMWMFEELGYDTSIFYKEGSTENKEEHRTEPKPIPEANGFYKDANRMIQYQKIGQINQLRTRILPKVFEGNPTSQDLGGGRPLRSVIWGNGVNRVFIVSNVSVSNQDINLPEGTTNWYDYLANNSNAIKAGTKVTMKPGEVKVYTAQYFQLPEVPTEYVFDDNTAIENIVIESNCVVYPTITDDVVFIETSEKINSVEVVNIQGQKVITRGNVNSINVSSLPQGLYMVIVNFDNTQESYKIYRK
jgi:1,4-alpha-glucan branching enzyme